ncbi:MAG: deoxycytidylate deaminase [Leptonema illini]|uniref:Deoxycytidylate deaminase n=1 Tax=Leptonema illini TaxID=183 RepID=A0A833GWY1_9LEPT|nr:MAG: deoxycytidylate deaminase [Leptonema illini]
MAVQKTEVVNSSSGLSRQMSKSTQDILRQVTTPEIVIGLCGPVGSPLVECAKILDDQLRTTFNYDVLVIRLSKFIEELSGTKVPASGFERFNTLINKGNELRNNYGNSILAEMAIKDIAVYRRTRKFEEPSEEVAIGRYVPSRTAFIINSLKNTEELSLLREVYGESFFLLGVSSGMQARVNKLKTQMNESELWQLIDRDSGEESKSGQSIRKIFHKSDYFITYDSPQDDLMRRKTVRFLNLCFRSEIETPTFMEQAMFAAYSASLNSACLSRQVGATLVDLCESRILSIGWNDVPKSGGGVYLNRTGNHDDSRCYNLASKRCYNDHEKSEMVQLIIDELQKNECLKDGQDLQVRGILMNGRIGQLLEFSRAVHAEMLALINARSVQFGGGVQLGLFTTTYPCHNCARHLVAAGVKRVYYIEPYRKSLAVKLHDDSIEESDEDENGVKMRLLQYEGAAPVRFETFFAASDRKREDGSVLATAKTSVETVKPFKLESIPIIEGMIVKHLENKSVVKL